MSGGDGHSDWSDLLTRQIHERGQWYLHLAYRILRDVEAAEDACQHAFCRAWEHRQRIEEPRALTSWLARTVVNEALQLLRRRQTEHRALSQHRDAPSSPCPVESLAQRDAVWDAVAVLEEPTRTVVVLRLVHGFSGNEVKAMLGCSAAEVSRRLHAGMETLRGQLSEFRESTYA